MACSCRWFQAPTLLLLLCGAAFAMEELTTGSTVGGGGAVMPGNFLGSPIEETIAVLRARDPAGRGFFFSTCGVSRRSGGLVESYSLIFPASGRRPVLVVTLTGNQVDLTANVAELSMAGGRLTVREAMGGEWTYKRLESIANHLLTKGFQFAPDYSLPLKGRAAEACPVVE